MLLTDVNVLVYAYREDSPNHPRFREWLRGVLDSPQAFAVAELVLGGFLRIVTHPSIFSPPTPLSDALTFVEGLRGQPNCVILAPGARHWEIFLGLCESANARGNLIPDAYLAALAIETGSEWITTDGDFARFPGLRWRRPF